MEREFADLDEIWKSEKAAVQGTTHIKEELERARAELDTARRAQNLARMSELQYGRIPELESQLQKASEAEQQETQLLRNKVSEEEIAEVVSRWTGIPVSKMLEGEREKLLQMEAELGKRVIGQNEAVQLVADAVIRAHPISGQDDDGERDLFCASLDHTIWFHRPLRADRWHLYDFTCQHHVGGRGLSFGHVFRDDGTHVATVAQEVLVRDARSR